MKNPTKMIKEVEKEIEKAQKKCVVEAYDVEKNDWNPKHFEYCKADLLKAQLSILKLWEAERKRIKEIIEESLRNVKKEKDKLIKKYKDRSFHTPRLDACIIILMELLSKIEVEKR